MTQDIESRGTDDELVNAVTDAQMNVECLEATLQDTREELCEQYEKTEYLERGVVLMTVALQQILEHVHNPENWQTEEAIHFTRGFVAGLCEKALTEKNPVNKGIELFDVSE